MEPTQNSERKSRVDFFRLAPGESRPFMLQSLLERSVIDCRLDSFWCFVRISTNSVKGSERLG